MAYIEPMYHSGSMVCVQAAQQLAESNLAATGLLLQEAEQELKVNACLSAQYYLTASSCKQTAHETIDGCGCFALCITLAINCTTT